MPIRVVVVDSVKKLYDFVAVAEVQKIQQMILCEQFLDETKTYQQGLLCEMVNYRIRILPRLFFANISTKGLLAGINEVNGELEKDQKFGEILNNG